MKRKLIASIAAAALACPAFGAEDAVIVLKRHVAAADAARDQANAARDQANAARDQADAWKRWADDFSREMRASLGTLYAPRMGSGKVVKGAPYSAEVVTETRQSLADGNVISRSKSGMVYRDSEGRTRQETATDGEHRSIHISDPVDNKHYILNPGAKRAVVLPLALQGADHKHKHVVRVDGAEVRVEDGNVTVDGKALRLPEPPVVVKRVQGPDGSRRDEVRVHVIRGGDGEAMPLPPMPPAPPMPPGAAGALVPPTPPTPPMPGVHTMRFESTAKLGKGATTALGMKELDGVRAEGKSTVWTIPAGEIGNRDPIRITSETWYSPDLQVMVESRYDDPRTGQSVYRLANIRRGEPPADLFKVPEEYQARSRGRS